MAAPRVMRCPVVVILGATGTGKSKLSLDIARLFKGEIISADSMQVYKGLDIITNKVKPEEQQNIPHHLIDCISPLTENSTIVEFRNKAVPIIDSLLWRNKLPIVVGGTFYYIESLLWKYLINEEDIEGASAAGDMETSDLNQEADRLSPRSRDTVETMETCPSQQPSRVPVAPAGVGAGALENNSGDQLTSDYRDTVVCSEVSVSQLGREPVPCVEPEEGALDSNREEQQATRDDSSVDKRTDVHSSDSGSSDNEDWGSVRNDRVKYEDKPTAELYEMLLLVDSIKARRLHPKDRRKILRALEVFDQHGVPMSEIYEHQHRDVGSDRAVSGPLRYPDTCIFWIQCNPDVLNDRLEKRVDAMLGQGLVQELTSFHTQYNKQRLAENKEADYTHGIFQSIGFKEFHDYLILSDEERDTDEGRKLLQNGTYELKAMTKRYARRQVRWVRNRILKRPSSNVLPVYAVDGTDISMWDEQVTQPAIGVLDSLIQGTTPSLEPLPYEGERTDEYAYNECTTCGKTFVLDSLWQVHLKSRKHRKRVAGHRKLLKNTTYILDKAIADARKVRHDDEKDQT